MKRERIVVTGPALAALEATKVQLKKAQAAARRERIDDQQALKARQRQATFKEKQRTTAAAALESCPVEQQAIAARRTPTRPQRNRRPRQQRAASYV